MKELTFGPLNKSLFTQELELIAKCLIHKGDSIKLETSKKADNSIELHAKINNLGINLTHLFKKANFTHLELNQGDSNKYQSNTNYHPYSPYPYAKGSSSYLTSAEISAIKSYTSSSTPFNFLLYNTNTYYVQDAPGYKKCIIDICMLGSGLKKIMPETGLHAPTYRGEFCTPQNEISERVKIINEGGGITDSKAFLSTSLNAYTANSFSGGKCEIHFDAPYGKKIYNLSHFPGEKEFLLPPSQLQWESYEKKGDKHIFHAKVVEPLIQGKDDPTQDDINTFKKLMNWATEQGIHTDFITDHLRHKIFETSENRPEQNENTLDITAMKVTLSQNENTSPIALADCISLEENCPLVFLQEAPVAQQVTMETPITSSNTTEALAANCAPYAPHIENTPVLIELMG